MTDVQIYEPRVYGLNSPWSFYADAWSRKDNPRAEERLARYARELAFEAERGTPEGRRAERIWRSQIRVFDPDEHRARATAYLGELRALTTGGGITATAASEAAAFVTPAFLLAAWAPFRGIPRCFADQCHKLPLPAFGMRAYLPYMSSAASASEQTEGSAVSETVPGTELEAAEVEDVTGQITVTQQLRDRAYSGGGSADVIIGRQLQENLDEKIDRYALNQAINNGKAVTGQATYSTAKLYQDLAKGREQLTDTAGTRLRPTHMFTTSDLYSYASRQVDSSERPIITPQFAPGFPVATGADDFDDQDKRPVWSRFTGTVMPGGVLWFEDDNIPEYGTTGQTQIIVSAPADAIVLMEDEPILTPFVEAKANELKVILNLRSYVAEITRHASGTAAVTSAAYKANLV
jgi:hypothetical protein